MKIVHSRRHIFLAWRNAVALGTFLFHKILILASPPPTRKTMMTWMATSKETPTSISCSENPTRTSYGGENGKTAEKPHQVILRSGFILHLLVACLVTPQNACGLHPHHPG
jgi:hypothetical protein